MLLFMGVRLPVSAVEEEYDVGNATGAATTSSMLFFYVETNTSTASARKNFFGVSGDTVEHPIVVTLDNGDWSHQSDIVTVRRAGVSTGYIEYIFSMPSAGILTFTDEAPHYYGLLMEDDYYSTLLHDFGPNLEWQFYIDGVLQGTYSEESPLPLGDYPVDLRFSFRVKSNDGVRTLYTGDTALDAILELHLQMSGYFTYESGEIVTDPTDPSDPSSPSDPSGGGSGSQDLTDVIESIEVVQGHLEEINGNVVDIKDSVDEIEVTIKDTHDQLENPDSNIWQAAGSAISDAVTGLFVPEQAELEQKMDEVEQIVIEKLGDTYEIVERVEVYEDELVNSFTDSEYQYSFNFPGITVPLPDGLVNILPAQSVSIENDAFLVFRNLLGYGVAFLCALSAIHIGHDVVICFFSGVSYWGFIRGRHDR